MNYALQPMSKDEFVKIVASGQPEVPAYFPRSAAKNLEGSAPLGEMAKPRCLTSHEIREFDGVVIDVRQNSEYGAGHIPNSINIGLGGQFASWAGTLIPIGTPIAVVAEDSGKVEAVVMLLARVGHESVHGFILIKDYDGDLKMVSQVSVADVSELPSGIQFVDVGRCGEFDAGHASGTINVPLDKLSREVDLLDPARPTYVICQGGYRSSMGTSILENAGFSRLYNVTGGTAAWMAAGLPVE